MKKQFVSYPIALALKELGFNHPCIARFNSDGELIILRQAATSDISLVSTIKNSEDITLFIGDVITPICAPLWQQVEEWFREKHSLFIEIELTDNTREKYYQYSIVDSKNREYHDEDMTDQAHRMCNFKDKYDTYTEAREAAILQAIEIIKNK